jgi:hypothetical protein
MKITSSVATTISILVLFGVTFGGVALTNNANTKVTAAIAELDATSDTATAVTSTYTPVLLSEYTYNDIPLWRFDTSVASATSDKTSEYMGIQIALATETYKNNKTLKGYSTSWAESTESMLDLLYDTDDNTFDLKEYMNNNEGIYTTCVRYNTVWEDYNIPVFDLIQLIPYDDTTFISVHISNGGSTEYVASDMIGVVAEIFDAYDIPWDAYDILSLERSAGNDTLLSDAQLLSGDYTDAKYFEFDVSTATITEYRANDKKAPTDVVIPPTISGMAVKAIGDNAFNKYSSGNKLTSVVIPDSVESIGNYAFATNTSLKYVSMPTGLKSLGEGVFSGDYALREIEIKGTLYDIPKNAFKACESLETVILPDTVVSFGDYAFSGCRLLSSMNVPASFRTYGTDVFKGCEKLDTTIFEERKE